jgi:conjugative relaxase-like TrwC/TraI family protein
VHHGCVCCTGWRWSGVAVVADLAKLSAGREDYYVREVAENREEYLSGHGESPGQWYGAGAAALGQHGVASTEAFKRIFEGRHPDTGELLGRAHGTRAVPAWDLVLRPVKDVGVLWALGDHHVNRIAMGAHHEGVAQAIAYLEAHVGTRRGHGGCEKVSGQGLLAVGFDHRTSRAGDPLPHTHLIIANRVQGPDGRWTTLDGRDLYRHRRAADALYRAAYQRALTRDLGVEWGAADRWGNRPIVGMPTEVVRSFSKRNEQIADELGRLEEAGRQRTARLVRFVVHATRTAKTNEAPETLYERWRLEARALGIDPDRLVRRVTGRAREQSVDARALTKVFDRLAGSDGLTGQASTFARQEVLVALGGELASASPADLQALTERFLAGWAVPVIDDRAEPGAERRWSTPDLLRVERALVAAAEGRQGEQAGVVTPEVVRATLAAHPTIGADQAGMVRDVCQRDDGVALVEGRAGTGKTFALGVARHAWQSGGHRVLGCAPTGIATMSLEAEGFEETATVDRLLAELDRHGVREVLGDRAVLVVDEAGMVGSRKLARLLDHAERTRAKVVLVGDDRQLAAIDAGGGFRALRVRLGASELVENRRQLHAWERDALELVRGGLVDEAVAAYRDNDRMVAAETKFELTLALVSDWWQAQQDAAGDPTQETVILAWQRGEVDRLNTLCQQVMAHHGRLGAQRLQVGDRSFAVGDRVVCGRNALATLGVANGTRGTVTALDPRQRTLSLVVDGEHAHEVTLPAWYLDGQRWGWQPDDDRRTIDLAYATTGHKAQGLTRWRALVRLTGREDANWLYVQLSRARHETTIYTQVGPEPHASEVGDLPERELPDGDTQLAQAIGRDGTQQLAIDTQARLDLRRLSTRELRAERDRLARLLAQAPKDQTRVLVRAVARREDAERVLAATSARRGAAAARVAELGRLGGLGRRRELGEARQEHKLGETAEQVARRQADRAVAEELVARRAQQQRAGWFERHPEVVQKWRANARELAWRGRARQAGIEAERPAWQERDLGPLPASVRGRRAWRQAAAQVTAYRDRYGVSDPERALGPEPRGNDLEQRRAWRACHDAAERTRIRYERARQPGRDQPIATRPDPSASPPRLPQRNHERATG